MIESINELVCLNCGLCEKLCANDVIRKSNGKMQIVYPNDCSNCMDCLFECPVDAITINFAMPKKFCAKTRWERIKEALVEESMIGN